MSHYHDRHTDHAAYMLLGGLLGVGIGTVIGMLVAPRGGRESREQIRHKVNGMQAEGRRRFNEGRRRARNGMRDAGEQASDAVERLKDDARDFRRDHDDADW